MNGDPLHPSDQTLQAFSLGKLDDGSVEAVNAHLEECAECRKRVAAMSSDSFLDRVRNGQNNRDSDRAAPSGSRPGHSHSGAAPRHTATLPPDLADHPDYQIVRELGRGGMGVVYLAHNRLMGRDEVLKVVSKHMLDRKGVLERFLREIRAAAQLHHANVVNAYSAFRSGDSIVFAMEYVDGVDLAKLVKTKGPLPVAHACYFTYQVALGLQHAHEQGLVHRDIKPANLMLARAGKKATVKVLDFGLAKATREQSADSALTREGQMLGTPDCIAPEQIRDAQSADIRADIYSLGCTLYYLLTGGPPFHAEKLWDLYQAHFSMNADPLNLVRPEVPAELAALVAKMMAKEPERRFQTPAEVAQALLPFFKDGLAKAAPMRTDVSVEGGPAVRQKPVPTKQVALPTLKPAAAMSETRWESLVEYKETEQPPVVPDKIAPEERKSWTRSHSAIPALLLGLAAVCAVMVTIRTRDGAVVTVKAVDPVQITVQPQTDPVVSPELESSKGVADDQDHLQVGTVWRGIATRIDRNARPDIIAELRVTKREGQEFEGVYTGDAGGQRHACQVRGKITGKKITWEKTVGISGGFLEVGAVNWDGHLLNDRIDIRTSFVDQHGQSVYFQSYFVLKDDKDKFH